jgi:hypothetical protein
MTHSSFLRASQQVVLLFTLAVVGLGCGVAPGVDVSDDGNGGGILNVGDQNQGFRAGDNIEIPESFPADMPRYAGATNKLALKENGGYTISQETSDDTDTVIRNLDQQLTQKGYSLTVRIGNVGEPIQIVTYGNTNLQTTIQLQVARDTAKNKTSIMIARVPKTQ